LYWLCCKLWAVFFGTSEAGLRSFSVICGVGTIPLMAKLGRQILGPGSGLLAAALFAIAPLEVELANEARSYALLHLLVVLNVWLFVRWVRFRGSWDWVFYTLTTALTWYSHYYAPVVQLAQLLALLLSPRMRPLLRPWIGAMLAAAFLWSPWLSPFLNQIRTPGNLQRGPGEGWLIQFAATPIAFGLGRTFSWRDSPMWMHLLAFIGVSVTLIWSAIRGIVEMRDRAFARDLLGGWALLPILCPLVIALLGKPIYSHRYAAIALPALLLTASFGLMHMRQSMRVGLLGILVVLTGVSLGRYASLPLKDDWRAASRFILQRGRPEEPVLFDKSYEIIPFTYYAARAQRMPAEMMGLDPRDGDPFPLRAIRYHAGKRVDPDSRDYTDQIRAAAGVWLALCLPTEHLETYEKALQALGFEREETGAFHRIDVIHYTRSQEKASLNQDGRS
jgi:4-amino-4-deoxy-L-arabinose transferase-like glycosyltransferase